MKFKRNRVAAAIITLLASFLSIAASIDEDLVVRYCEAKNLAIGTIFTCQSKKENAHLLNNFAKMGLRFLIADIRNENLIVPQVLKRNYHHLAVILDGNCFHFAEKLLHNKHHFYETYHWLILSPPSLQAPILNLMSEAPSNINSDINLAILDLETEEWPIFDLYNPASNHQGRFTLTKIGHYCKAEGFRARIEGNKYWTRKNMTGVRFKSAVVVPDPKLDLQGYLTSEENRKLHSMHRFQSVTVNYCREMYNFSLRIERTDSWGYLTPNGHFDGLVGLLERRMVDFGSSPLIYKLDRMPVVDYSYGNWILRSTFIYRRPKMLEASYKIFLRPLSTTVWIYIGVMMSLLMLFLKVIFSREKRLLGKLNLVDDTWSFLFLFTLGAFCQQGATCYPQLISSRTLSVFVFLFCILIYQFYSASIVSYLLMDPPRRINNLKDLADSDLRAGIEDILIDRNYFVQTTDPAAIELYDKKIKHSTNNSGYYEPAGGLELVRKGGFAFHVETSTAYPIIEETFTNEEICELEEVQMYRTQPMHTNLQKNSPFREMMNYCMLHLVENGLLYRLREYWDARTPTCIESAKKVELHVGLKEFSAGLIVLSYGICLALIMLLGEVIITRTRKEVLGDFLFKRNVIKPFTE